MRRFIASTFLLGLTACQHDVSQIQEYPARWPAIVIASERRCQSIAGTYQYMGEWARPLANGAPRPGMPVITSSSVSGAPQTVRLEYAEKDGRLTAYVHNTEVTRRSSGFTCLDGWMSRTITFDGGGNGESGRTSGNEVIRFAPAEDGSLIAEFLYDTQNFQLFGIVQSENHSRIYARFLRADAADGK